MKLNFHSITNSRTAVRFGLWVGRTFPLNAAHRFGDWLARQIANRDSSLTRAIRGNQWVVRGENATRAELDQAVREVLCHAGYCFADLYRHLTDPEGLKALVPLTKGAQALIAHSAPEEPGAFIVAPHMSAFDLVLLAMAYRGLRGRVLTYGSPTGGYKVQNKLRAATGLEIAPVRGQATEAEAIEFMRNGGLLITAVDRPIRKKAHMLNFFGHPSPLPVGHIRMALQAEVPVVVAAPHLKADGKYHLELSDPIPMQPHTDPQQALRQNAETVLGVIAEFIRKNPGQWLMYYPVWSDLQVPEK